MCSARYKSPNRTHDKEILYKYLSPDTARIVLRNCTLRWSAPSLFNDPFDVTGDLRLGFNALELNAALTERVARALSEAKSLPVRNPFYRLVMQAAAAMPRDVRQEMAAEVRALGVSPSEGQSDAFSQLKEEWKRLVPRMRILCLSERPDITSMWNHYCSGYKGVCIGFRVIDEIDSALLVARPVVYGNSPPSITKLESWVTAVLGESEFQPLFDEYQYFKTPDWAAEKEWRIVTHARNHEVGLFSDYPFLAEEVSRVIFGPQAPDDFRCELGALVKARFRGASLECATVGDAGHAFEIMPWTLPS